MNTKAKEVFSNCDHCDGLGFIKSGSQDLVCSECGWNRVTLKAVKICVWASEETLCFQASVYFDGERIATAHNDGHGGCTYFRHLPNKGDKLIRAYKWAEALPPVQTDMTDPNDPTRQFIYNQSLDNLVDEMVSR